MGKYDCNAYMEKPFTYGSVSVWKPDQVIILSVGAFYKHWLILIPVWTNNHMPSKIWDAIAYHCQISTVQPLKFGNG